MPLKTVLIDREKLRMHGNWNEPLRQLLLGLYRYDVAVVDVGGINDAATAVNMRGVNDAATVEDAGGISDAAILTELPPADPKNCLMIADCEESIRQAEKWQMAVLGYEPPSLDMICSSLPITVEGFEEVDFYFMERVYQRYHHLPWTVVETKRCLLREITLEDLDALYELYRPKEMTRYMDGLYENRQKEEAYTKAYIEHMYRFYGYGLWLVVEKETDQIIGRAGLGNLEVEGEVQLELGYLIAKEKQRQGYATEVCLGILDYARAATDFATIHCLIQKENRISIHLAEKLGFCWEKSVICNGKEMQRYSKILQT